MIGKILKSGSFGSKVDYVTREKHDKKVFTPDTWRILGSQGLMGEKRNQIVASFEAQAMQKPKISNPAGHITLSFAAEDKPKLSDEKMLKIALDYIKMMGLDKTQWLIVRHYETDKPHCHIVFNMVGDNGKRMESGRNRYRNKHVCEALTKRYRLALPRQETPDLEKLYGLERAKAEIKIAANEALRNSRDWNTFAVLLARKNIHIIPKYRRGTQDLQGVSFQMGDYKVKGSDVGEAFKYKSLERYFSQQSRQSAPKRTAAQFRSPQSGTSSISDEAMRVVKATAATAVGVVAEIGESVGQFVGGLFQPGPAYDPDEERLAWELSHPKKKKPKRGIKR
jgi:relaxase/mobilization nuclease domain protein